MPGITQPQDEEDAACTRRASTSMVDRLLAHLWEHSLSKKDGRLHCLFRSTHPLAHTAILILLAVTAGMSSRWELGVGEIKLFLDEANGFNRLSRLVADFYWFAGLEDNARVALVEEVGKTSYIPFLGRAIKNPPVDSCTNNLVFSFGLASFLIKDHAGNRARFRDQDRILKAILQALKKHAGDISLQCARCELLAYHLSPDNGEAKVDQ